MDILPQKIRSSSQPINREKGSPAKDKDEGWREKGITVRSVCENDWERMVILITIILVVSIWCYRLA